MSKYRLTKVPKINLFNAICGMATSIQRPIQYLYRRFKHFFHRRLSTNMQLHYLYFEVITPGGERFLSSFGNEKKEKSYF
jgi:hypothetical protein